MQIFDDKKKRVGTLTGYRNMEITRTLNTGDKSLSFEYPAHGRWAQELKEECYLKTKTDEFVLRAVDISADWNKYTAQLNVEELEGRCFPKGFTSKEQTLRTCLGTALEETGWKIGVCESTKIRTIEIKESTTTWNIIQECVGKYRVEVDFDTLKKTINIYEMIGQDRGAYFMEGLNLRKLEISSDTYDFYTRIIPIGKDGLTIEAVYGKTYLENYQYSSKIKTYVWQDESYVNAQSLIEDAEAKLDEMSRPYKAFAAAVVDLAKASDGYSALDYQLGDVVTIISKRTGTREKQRIVKIIEYPKNPEKNTVELSNAKKSFVEGEKIETEATKREAVSIARQETAETLEKYSTTEQTNSYTDTKVKEEADRAREAEKDLGVQVEETKSTLSNEIEDTKSGLRSEIKQTADSITLTVENVKNGLKSEIKQTADSITQTVENKEKALKSEIKQTADKITSVVSDLSDTNEKVSKIEQTADKINFIVKSGTSESNFKMTDGAIELISKELNITGCVTFNDLKNTGKTVINGSNITTGVIDATKVTVKNLSASNITTGSLDVSRVTAGGYPVIGVSSGNAVFGTSGQNVVIGSSAARIGFWGHGGSTRATITTPTSEAMTFTALKQLLNALRGYGLIN